MKVKSPNKRHTLEFLKFLQSNHYLSASGVEYCAEEVDSLLLEKCTDREKFDSVSVWSGIFEEDFRAKKQTDKIYNVPLFPWYLRINPSLERS